MPKLLQKRGTRAQLEAAKTANQLNAGEVYIITDEHKLAFGLSTNDYEIAEINSLKNKKVAKWTALGIGATTINSFGFMATTTLGTATSRSFASTNKLSRSRRLGYNSATSAGSFAGITPNSTAYTVGSGTGLGGFRMLCRAGQSDNISDARFLIGFSTITGANSNVEPNTLLNTFGFAKLSTDTTQWYFVYGGSTAQPAIPMGTAVGSPNSADLFEFELFSDPNIAGHIKFTVTNLETGVISTSELSGLTTTQFPPSTTLMGFRIWRCNNATASAALLDLVSVYIETDT